MKNPIMNGTPIAKIASITESFLSLYNSLHELSSPAMNIRQISAKSPRPNIVSVFGSMTRCRTGPMFSISPHSMSATTEGILSFFAIYVKIPDTANMTNIVNMSSIYVYLASTF